MNGTTEPDLRRPKLPRGVRLKHDETRQSWLLLAPERVVTANPIAVEILKRCDGDRTIRDIVDELALAYKADRSRIETDVLKLLDDLALKRMVDL
jgi:pyrroloquinoline quinone biosynthesis protein D